MTVAALLASDEPVLRIRLTDEAACHLVEALNEHKWLARVVTAQPGWAKDDLLDALADEFAFPDYFGRNWDALVDCWSDMSWSAALGYACILLGSNELASEDREALISVAQDVAERLNGDGIGFRLVLTSSA